MLVYDYEDIFHSIDTAAVATTMYIHEDIRNVFIISIRESGSLNLGEIARQRDSV